MENYFIGFLAKIGGDIKFEPFSFQDMGNFHYWSDKGEFNLNDGSLAVARFTFILEKEGEEWKIIHHHNSLMPE